VHRYRPIIEALALLAVTLPLAVALRIPTLWLLTPLLVITYDNRSYAVYGLSLRHPGSAGFHAVVMAAVFLPYALGHYAFARWWYGATFQLRLPPGFWALMVEQVLVIALPEEFFFRGYLQTQCDQVWGKPNRLFGARWGIGLPVAAALFAACHVLYGGPARLIVFFPGVLYGWLRARTESILVPTLYHAGSNLLMQIMLASLAP
jgi:membrane protease YdiL (CAAX protease family)